MRGSPNANKGDPLVARFYIFKRTTERRDLALTSRGAKGKVNLLGVDDVLAS